MSAPFIAQQILYGLAYRQRIACLQRRDALGLQRGIGAAADSLRQHITAIRQTAHRRLHRLCRVTAVLTRGNDLPLSDNLPVCSVLRQLDYLERICMTEMAVDIYAIAGSCRQ